MTNVYRKFKELERYGFDHQIIVAKHNVTPPEDYEQIQDYWLFKSKKSWTIFHPDTGKMTFCHDIINKRLDEVKEFLKE